MSIWSQLSRGNFTKISHVVFRMSITSFCLLAARASSSWMRCLSALWSSSLSDINCWTKPMPMHLKGEPEPLGFEEFFSNLLDDKAGAWVAWGSIFTFCANASNALNCFDIRLKPQVSNQHQLYQNQQKEWGITFSLYSLACASACKFNSDIWALKWASC